MMRKIVFLLAFVACLVSVTVAQDRPVLQDEAAQAAWRDDLRVMMERMQNMHPNLFWRTPEADFKQAAAALDADIPYRTDEQIKVGLMQIVALVDGHTQIGIFQPAFNFHMYGLRLYMFTDGLYVVDAQPQYKEAIGKKLVAVGNINVDDVFKQVSMVAQHDNDHMLQLTTAFYMVVPEVLNALNITANIYQPEYVVEDASDQRITINPTPLTLDEYLKWGNGYFITLPPNPDLLYLQHQYDEAFWFTYLADSKTLYIQFNEVVRMTASGKTMQQFADEIESFVETAPIERIIVDMRHNSGGDNRTYSPLLRLLQQNEKLNRPDKLYVMIGRMTLSAGVSFSSELEHTLHPIFVGEPTGEPPNVYANARILKLPNSKIEVNVSTHFEQKSTADDTRLWITPSIAVSLSSTDYFNGRDPALEAILTNQNS
jgi:hypothetical protein